MFWLSGFHTVYLPFTAETRGQGVSKFNYGSLFELALVGITSFSQKPLRLISRMGFVVSALSFLYGLYIVIETLLFGSDAAELANHFINVFNIYPLAGFVESSLLNGCAY